jgi:micrococcal nuclease
VLKSGVNLVSIFCFLFAFDSYSFSSTKGWIVHVVSVHDGDTFNIEDDTLPEVFGKNLPVRVLGIDSPEIHGKLPCEQQKAQEAKQIASQLLLSAKVVELSQIQRDKYFRVLADVKADGVSLKDTLLAKGLAYPYFGATKKKLNWCKKGSSS